jgi:hypothetical protein
MKTYTIKIEGENIPTFNLSKENTSCTYFDIDKIIYCIVNENTK